MPQLPVILTAFANSYDEAYLSHLEKEHDRLLDILAPLSYLRHVPLSSAKTGQLVSTLTQYQQELLILHFGGHADGSQLHFKDAGGQVAGLAENLSLHPQLKLVFLNGCNTQAQAVQYLDAGVPAVIATTCSVADGQAMQFAEVFYTALAKGHTLEEAFVRAKGAMKMVDGGTRGGEIINLRGVRLRQEQVTELSWRLYVAGDEVLGWKLEMVEDKVKSLPILLNNVPTNFDPNTDCIGRETELAELHQKLSNSPKVALVRGLGGIGKTTLAQAYVALYQKHYQHMIWVTQGSDLVRTIALDPSLAQSLKLPFQAEEDLETRFVQLVQTLRTIPGPNLLVIDNATEQVAQRDTVQQLPNAPNWKVLVTSRQDLSDFAVLELRELEPDAALKLFRLYYQEGADLEVMELLAEIGYHTLTTELLAKTLQRKRGLLNLAQILEALRKRQLDDPNLSAKLWARHSGEEKGLFNYLMRLFELAELNDREIWVMQQFAVLPALPLEVSLLADWLTMENDELNEILNELADRGWLNVNSDGFLVHRLVQEVVKYKQAPGEKELNALVEMMKEKMMKKDHGNPITDNFPWLNYAEKVATYFLSNKELSINISTLWNNLATILIDSGNYSDALKFLDRSLETDIHTFGEEHPSVAIRRSNLASLYYELGNYQDSVNLYLTALESDLRNFGEGHPEVATNQSNLANALSRLGQNPLALQFILAALNTDIRMFGKDHPRVSVRLSNLASILSDIDYHFIAFELLEVALKSDIQNFGQNHPEVSTKRSNLGLEYSRLGRHAQAIEHLESALNTDLNNYGSHHLTIAIRQWNLAGVYCFVHRELEAKNLLEQALSIVEKKLGIEHQYHLKIESLLNSVNEKLNTPS